MRAFSGEPGAEGGVTVCRITTDHSGRTVSEQYDNGMNLRQQSVAAGHVRLYQC